MYNNHTIHHHAAKTEGLLCVTHANSMFLVCRLLKRPDSIAYVQFSRSIQWRIELHYLPEGLTVIKSTDSQHHGGRGVETSKIHCLDVSVGARTFASRFALRRHLGTAAPSG